MSELKVQIIDIGNSGQPPWETQWNGKCEEQDAPDCTIAA